MKLLARDKQRLQWAVTAVIGGAAVLYACTHLFIRPLRQAKVEGLNQLAKYQERIDQATGDLRSLASIRAEVGTLQEAVATATNLYVLRPVLGSTLVTVQNFIDPIAQECGLQIDSCAERGRMEVPVNMKDAVVTIERYLTEITATGPYTAVRAFVMALEKTNSYVCVTDVEIIGQPGDVLKHKARICVEWPVFGQPRAPAPVRPGAASRTEDEL
ncbi:MAG: hypothetical protein ACOYOU_01400 [Kiritimatiellia bacterium]